MRNERFMCCFFREHTEKKNDTFSHHDCEEGPLFFCYDNELAS